MNPPRTIVVGGGLAGLTAAASLARAGCAVTVLEAAEHLGGRARTRRRDGFDLNLGPHALYRAGGGLAVLRGLGVRPSGRMPRLHRAGALVDGRVVPAFAHLRTAVDERVRVLKLLIGLGERAAAEWSGRTTEEWLDELLDDRAGRELAASVVRTATYTADHALLDAGAASHQVRLATHGVLYLHGGWASLVEGLVDVIGTNGGEVRTATPVDAVEHDTGVRAVRVAGGTTMAADGVVIAVSDPHRAARLLDGEAAATVAACASAAVPVRMAHLDVALRPLPVNRFPNVLGMDEPVFLSVQSDVADVAPPGGAVIHVGRYLRPDDEQGDHRASLERFLDAAQPGWRDHVVDARYVPRSMVCADHARPATAGAAGRPATGVAGVAGLALAGDWIGPAGMLADASIRSGAAAASAIMEAMATRSVSA